MSTAAFSANGFSVGTRRATARRLTVVSTVQPFAATSVAMAIPLSAYPAAASKTSKPQGINPLGVAAVVLALHIGLIYYLKHRPVEVVTPVVTAPIAVELAAPPVTEPPKVLPQTKLAPPPPPVTPHIDQPPPPPVLAPLPAITPQTPVVQAPPPAPLTPPPVAAVPERVTSAVGYAGYLNNPQPDYPQFAIDQGWEGRVLLGVHVLANGRADHVDIKQGSGHKLLDEIASKTVLQRWAFTPAKRGQTAIDGWVEVPIDFKLAI